MTLRPYAVGDWTAVREIYDLSKPDELRGVVDPEAVPSLEVDPDMKALFRDSEIIVAVEGDRLVGFTGSHGNFITWLFVHPSFRRRGVATRLLSEVLRRLNPPVTLNVATSNVAARALYERVGFKIEREFMGRFRGTPCAVTKLRYEPAA